MIPDKIEEAMSLLIKSLTDGIQHIEVPEDDQYMLDAAHSRVLELRSLLSAITGKGVPFVTQVRPLTHAIDNFMKRMEAEYMQPIPDDIDDLEKQLMTRDEIDQLMNQARIAALSFLAHINACYLLIPTLKRVK
jgi:hypothetical protein